MLDLLMKDHLHIDKAVIVGLSFYFSELFLSFAFHLSPPDTFSSLYLLFGLFLSLHRNHPHRGACHLYLLISSIPVPLGALLHLNVRLMRPPHPPDTSAQRPLKAFVEEGESAGRYKLKPFLRVLALKGNFWQN